VIAIHNDKPSHVDAVIASLLAQTIPIDELMLIDQGSDNESSRRYQAHSRDPRVKYFRIDGCTRTYAFNAGLRRLSDLSTHVLISSGVLGFHPRLLDTCIMSQRHGPRFIHGHSHVVPPMMEEFGLSSGLSWDSCASLAYIEATDDDCWHFVPRSCCQKAGLYDERLIGVAATSEAVARAQKSPGLRLLRFPADWVVAVRIHSWQ